MDIFKIWPKGGYVPLSSFYQKSTSSPGPYVSRRKQRNVILAIFLSTTFYDLKVTFEYIGESPENFMSKYTHEL